MADKDWGGRCERIWVRTSVEITVVSNNCAAGLQDTHHLEMFPKMFAIVQ